MRLSGVRSELAKAPSLERAAREQTGAAELLAHEIVEPGRGLRLALGLEPSSCARSAW